MRTVRRTLRFLFGFTAISALALWGDLSHPAPAAAAACEAAINNFFDGYGRYSQVSGEVWEGVSGAITVQYGGLCSGHNGGANFNTAWVMLASSDGAKYAQSGFMRYNFETDATHFTEWNNGDGTSHRVKKYNVAAGERHRYWVQYRADRAKLSLNVDTTHFDDAPNPFGNYKTPLTPQFNGEALSRTSSIPGISSARTTMSPIQTQRFDNDQYQNFATNVLQFTANGNPNSWKQSLPNSSTVQIWSQ